MKLRGRRGSGTSTAEVCSHVCDSREEARLGLSVPSVLGTRSTEIIEARAWPRYPLKTCVRTMSSSARPGPRRTGREATSRRTFGFDLHSKQCSPCPAGLVQVSKFVLPGRRRPPSTSVPPHWASRCEYNGWPSAAQAIDHAGAGIKHYAVE